MLKLVSSYFLIWRFGILAVLLFCLTFIPLQSTDKFLGGGVINYHRLPEIFAQANFDGEHFLSITAFGYSDREQAFFPLYPLVVHLVASPFKVNIYSSLLSSVIVGVVISSVCFLAALLILSQLLKLDYSNKTISWTLILLLVFPTSFFFGIFYSESLFFLLLLLSFYFARRERWVISGVFGMLASSTRVFGILLLPALMIEACQQGKRWRDVWGLLLIPLGLLGYMIYQWQTSGDPLAFYHLQGTIGEQRQLGLVPYPQVLFRYIRMLTTVSMENPIYQTVLLEFLVGVVFLLLPIVGFFKKVRWSYLFFALFGLLLSPFQGSLSSVPRYVIVLFPSFVILAMLVSSWTKFAKVSLVITLSILLIVEASLFFRGFWIG